MNDVEFLEPLPIPLNPDEFVALVLEVFQYILVSTNLNALELFDTDVYRSGRLGLKKLNEENRLEIFQTDCKHSQHKEPECFHQLKPLFEKYLL